MKHEQDFKIRLNISDDTVIMSYDQKEMEKLKPEVAADLLNVLREKYKNSDKFFEYEPANFADSLLSFKKQLEFRDSHNDNFLFLRHYVLKSITYNASNDENDFCDILNSLYKYENIISNVELLKSPVQYRTKNLEVQFKDLTIMNELQPLTAMSFPAYASEFLNKAHAKNNNKPFEHKFAVSSESKHYVYNKFMDKIKISPKEQFNKMSFFLQNSITDTAVNITDVFNCLKIMDAVNLELQKEIRLESENITTTKKNKP